MTHSKLIRSFFLVAALGALALTGAGCAMDASEAPGEETAESSSADLRKSPMANSQPNALSENAPTPTTAIMPKAPIAPKLIGNDHILGGGRDDDGPRPHPWEPTPDSNNTNTNSGSSGGTSSSK